MGSGTGIDPTTTWYERQMRAVILAGGRGARLQPFTTVLPKPLMPIGDLPILEVLIRQLVRAGICDIVLAVGYLSSLIEAVIGDGERLGARIQYSREQQPLGTAGPLSLVSDLGDSFLVMNGDLLTTLDFQALIQFHQQRAATATLATFRKQYTIDLGVLTVEGQDSVVGYTEKPSLELVVSTGIYVFEREVLAELIPGERLDLPDLIRALIARDRPVSAYPFDGIWLDIGRHDDYQQAIEQFERARHLFLPD